MASKNSHKESLPGWSPYARSYDPLKAGSIDGTDHIPHDNAVIRAMSAEYKPPDGKHVTSNPSLTLFVGRLNLRTSERQLHDEFSMYGRVHSCRLVRDVVTGSSRGYGFVEFEREIDAQRAWRNAHATIFHQRQILVEWEFARTMPGWIPRRLGGGLGGKKESGQLRFGGRDRPFKKPFILPVDTEIEKCALTFGNSNREESIEARNCRNEEDNYEDSCRKSYNKNMMGVQRYQEDKQVKHRDNERKNQENDKHVEKVNKKIRGTEKHYHHERNEERLHYSQSSPSGYHGFEYEEEFSPHSSYRHYKKHTRLSKKHPADKFSDEEDSKRRKISCDENFGGQSLLTKDSRKCERWMEERPSEHNHRRKMSAEKHMHSKLNIEKNFSEIQSRLKYEKATCNYSSSSCSKFTEDSGYGLQYTEGERKSKRRHKSRTSSESTSSEETHFKKKHKKRKHSKKKHQDTSDESNSSLEKHRKSEKKKKRKKDKKSKRKKSKND